MVLLNEIVMSKLCYLSQVWAGCENYLVRSLQVLQNRAARAVTGNSWFTTVTRLLQDCKWLSIKDIFEEDIPENKAKTLSKDIL